MKNYICDGTKYTYNKGYITLPVEINNLPEQIYVEGLELHPRSTFHVSLLCVKNLIEKYGDKIQNLEQKILEYFCTYIAGNEISFLGYKDVFRLATFEERRSVVVLCGVSDLDNFIRSLESHLDIEISLQPTHATLYTLQPDVGIGLNSQADMKEKSVPIQVSEDVRRSLGLV
ncbi:MAG: hypothetical protein Q8P56_04955 [Candidatus Uhrbacteria bacterium]|nr:hypothetical protein [Candidatus Uhrbacteria bacterium]